MSCADNGRDPELFELACFLLLPTQVGTQNVLLTDRAVQMAPNDVMGAANLVCQDPEKPSSCRTSEPGPGPAKARSQAIGVMSASKRPIAASD